MLDGPCSAVNNPAVGKDETDSRAPQAPAATSAAVARLAAVSKATVSRAFNSPQLLDRSTLERVRDAARQLDYRPNGLARSLRSRRSLVVGVLIPSLNNAYFAETVERVQVLLSGRGYTTVIASSRYEPAAELAAAESMAAQGVDAMLLVGRGLNPQTRPALARRSVPNLRCWVWPDEPPCVGFDHPRALAEVTRHLLALGHRRFAVVSPFVALHDVQRSRLAAIRDTLAEAGIALPAAAVIDHLGFGIEAGRAALAALRGLAPAPTAVICSNDHLAAGVILQARAQGLRVPQDLSVTGYNDLEIARAFEPAITTVETPMHDHAQATFEALMTLVEGRELTAVAALPTRLVPRHSSGPAPQARG